MRRKKNATWEEESNILDKTLIDDLLHERQLHTDGSDDESSSGSSNGRDDDEFRNDGVGSGNECAHSKSSASSQSEHSSDDDQRGWPLVRN